MRIDQSLQFIHHVEDENNASHYHQPPYGRTETFPYGAGAGVLSGIIIAGPDGGHTVDVLPSIGSERNGRYINTSETCYEAIGP